MTTATIPTEAFHVRIAETGQHWWRVYGRSNDELWTDNDGPTVPSYGLKHTNLVAQLGTIEIVEID